jgi:hypothetical protein
VATRAVRRLRACRIDSASDFAHAFMFAPRGRDARVAGQHLQLVNRHAVVRQGRERLVSEVETVTFDVERARILRSIPLLDQAAIECVMTWEYLPTLIDGVPQLITMTATVSFAL